MERSAGERLATLPEAERRRIIGGLGETVRSIEHHWPTWARPGQRAPAGDWHVWLMLGGRGFGKTRAGAEWVRAQVEQAPGVQVALVGATYAEARAVMVEGESGLLAIAPPGSAPCWEPSLRRLRWPGGGTAYVYSAAEPEALRGPQHHFAWADEIAKWKGGDAAWDNLAMGLRLGQAPRIVATTTPRPVPLVRRLMALPGVTVTRGRTAENRAHLADSFVATMEALYGGTRLGRQELDGELIAEIEGALWSRALIEACRRDRMLPAVRTVVAVDPPAGAGAASDACGIVAVALGADGVAQVIEDASVQGATPEGWARAVSACAARQGADRVVAEANNGGAMVDSVLRAADRAMPVKLVHASRGKVARAEPVAALYEAGRAVHVGAFPQLEDEMAGLLSGGAYVGPGRSPDRADALVWAMTELMLGRGGAPGLRML